MRKRCVFTLMLVAALTGCGDGRQAAREAAAVADVHAPVTVTDWPLPTRQPGSAWPGLVLAADGRLLLSWTNAQPGRRNVLQFSAYSPARQYWLNPPTTIAVGNRLRINDGSVPHLGTSYDGALWAQWVQGTDSAGVVMISRSRDGGANWSAPQTPSAVADINTDSGLATVWPEGGAGIGLAWLEGVEGGSAVSLHTASVDAAGQPGAQALLELRPCSAVSAAVTARGPLLAWCRRVADDTQAIVVTRHGTDGWTAQVPVHTNARCPGGDCLIRNLALAGHDGTVLVAWSDADGGQPVIRVARSTDAGETFAAPVEIARGSLSTALVAAALDARQVWLLWRQVNVEEQSQSLWLARRSPDLQEEYERREIVRMPQAVSDSKDYLLSAPFVLTEGTGYLVLTDDDEGITTLRGVVVRPGTAVPAQ